ncbi:MAG: ABC transporter ATP-binding protein, partial [Thermodesulfobacteriota bacterium]
KNKTNGIYEKLEYYVELFELQDLLKQKAYTLSGGQKRKVEIVRALLIEPHFILLDEPFTGIDPIGVSQLKEIFNTLKNQGIGLLISDHNVRETLKICDRGYVIAEGEIIGEGTPQELLNNPLVKEKYLGDSFTI